ncbi:MAG: WbuC family cupin fold metalloprotein [Balneolaceae bacterium]
MPKLAFDNPSGKSFSLTEDLIEKGLKASHESSRKRMILPIHRTQDAEVHRMINFLQPDTYIRPHKHPLPHATESLVVLKGAVRFFTFDDSGQILSRRLLDSVPFPGVMDIEPEVWHSFLVMEPDTVLFECKKGPYDAQTDKIFAEWAPGEGEPGVEKWLAGLDGG